jgi:hypothetical protein
MRTYQFTAALAGALVLHPLLVAGEDWDALFMALTSTDPAVSAAARNRSFNSILPALIYGEARYVEEELKGILKQFESNPNIKLQASALVATLALSRQDGSQVLSKAVPVLIQSLKDSAPRVRFNSASALSNLKPEIPTQAGQALLLACNDADRHVVSGAVYGAARLAVGSPIAMQATQALAAVLSSNREDATKLAVLQSIKTAGVKDARLTQTVGELLSSENDSGLVKAALATIQSFGPPAIVSLQGRIRDLELATSNEDIAATARAMLKSLNR